MLKIRTIDGQHLIASNHKELVIQLRQQDHAQSPDFRHYMEMVQDRHSDIIEFKTDVKNVDHPTVGSIRIGSPVAFINSLHKLGYIIEIEQIPVHGLTD